MAKKAPRKKAPKAMTEKAGNLEQVRDILFGGQMRDLDKRFARIEERLQKDLVRLREDVNNSLSSLEAFTKQEIAALSERLKTEHKDRAAGHKELSQGLKDLGRNLDKRINAVDEAAGEGIGELREQLLEASKSLRDEVQNKYAEVSDEISREAGDLREEKANSADIAALLAEMAVRLNGEGGKKGGRKGK